MDQARLEQLSDLLSEFIGQMSIDHPCRQGAIDLDYLILDLLEQIEDSESDGMSLNPEIEAERLRD